MKCFLKVTLLLSFLFLNLTSFSQTVDFTEETNSFFESNQPQFEKWLDNEGISNLLHIYTIETDLSNDIVYLILESNFSSIDSTSSVWERLKLDFDKSHVDSIEERIFKKFCFLMDVPLNQCKIEIHHKVKTSNEGVSCFVRIIKHDEELKTIPMSCQQKIFRLGIEEFDLRPDLRHSKLKSISKQKVITKNIKESIDSLFSQLYEIEKNGNLTILNSGKRYKVTDLEKEVLKDVPYSLLQRSINYWGGDSGRNEYLEIEIEIDYDFEDTIDIKLGIDGKYGSKTFKPRDSMCIDMEDGYAPELQSYVENLGILIRTHLTNDN